MDKKPKLINYSRMKDVFDAHISQIYKHAFINRELGMLYGDPSIFLLIIQQHKPPFTINDFRMGLIVQGHVKIHINLVEKELNPGMLLFVGPGTIIHPVSFTDDLQIYGIGLFDDFPMPYATGQMSSVLPHGREGSHSEETKQAWNFSHLPAAFNGQVRDFQVMANDGEFAAVRRIIDTIWHLVHQPDYNRQAVSSLVAAMMHLYNTAYFRHADLLKASQSREQTIFDRFIYLVNQYATQEHHIRFYADKMCLTERYLGTVIRQASGTTAKEWIDRALITRIKVELKHSEKSIAQISDELNFPNPSFFSKYFKRETCLSPTAFRESP